MFIISAIHFSVNEKKPASIRISPNARRLNKFHYSVYNRRQKSRLSQPIPLFSFPHMDAPAPSDTATMV